MTRHELGPDDSGTLGLSRKLNSTWCCAAALSLSLAFAPMTRAAQAGLPLPDAPVRVLIADVSAFDTTLTGSFRAALTGELGEDDALAAAWRRTQVGSKLEEQWRKLAGDLPWTWTQIRRLQPRSVGLALLQVGQLEAVLVIETPLAVLPGPLPAGQVRSQAGVSYHIVTAGAGDGSPDAERRMGLCWAQSGGLLILATSERALKLSLADAAAGKLFAAPLPGLISMELDLEVLRKDRYFRREFLWSEGPEQGRIRAALRLEGGHLVEVREGQGASPKSAASFEAPGAAAAGWESDGATLWPALRAALLEPLPILSDKPLLAVAALPATKRAEAEDRYLMSLEKPPFKVGEARYEAGDLLQWLGLFAQQQIDGWGFVVDADGTRRLVFAWPESRDAELETLCRTTVERRAGRSSVQSVAGAREIQVGPGLPALALRRTGAYIWLGPSARALSAVAAPKSAGDVVRWGRVDLSAVRSESERWAKVEGPGSPEAIRPFSDRILGLLAWMPATRALQVERSRTSTGWTERVVFQAGQP